MASVYYRALEGSRDGAEGSCHRPVSDRSIATLQNLAKRLVLPEELWYPVVTDFAVRALRRVRAILVAHRS